MIQLDGCFQLMTRILEPCTFELFGCSAGMIGTAF